MWKQLNGEADVHQTFQTVLLHFIVKAYLSVVQEGWTLVCAVLVCISVFLWINGRASGVETSLQELVNIQYS